MAVATLDDMDSCAKRDRLVNAIAAKARVVVSYVLDPCAQAVPYSRIRGGHLELYTAAGWQRSTDLLNLNTASS